MNTVLEVVLGTIIAVGSNVSSRLGVCNSVSECYGNGDCINGACVCDSAWSASPNCDVLHVLPSKGTSFTTGYHNSSGYASWGGNVVEVDGTYHLFVAQFTHKCSLLHWGSNSEIIRAESNSPSGPFHFAQTIIKPFAHNPTIRKLPDGSYVLYMIGGNGGGPQVNCENKTSTVQKPSKPASNVISRETYVKNLSTAESGSGGIEPGLFSGSIHVSHSPSVQGPWTEPTPVQFTGRSDLLYGGFTNPSPHFNADGRLV